REEPVDIAVEAIVERPERGLIALGDGRHQRAIGQLADAAIDPPERQQLALGHGASTRIPSDSRSDSPGPNCESLRAGAASPHRSASTETRAPTGRSSATCA